MDVAALKALRPSAFEDAADGYRATSDMAGQARTGVENDISAKMQAKLDGAAATAAHTQLKELAENFHYIQVECGLVSTALRAFAAEVRPAKQKFDAAVAEAESHRFTVGADGSVTYPAAGEKDKGVTPHGGTATADADRTVRAIDGQAAAADPNPHHVIAQSCADTIFDALREATAVDEKWAPHLRKLIADDDLTVSTADWNDVRQDTSGVADDAKSYLARIPPPPENGDPAADAAWWKSLTPQERADYLAAYPAKIGALDGLPAPVRDEANRTVLDETYADYQKQLAAIPPEPTKFVPLKDAVIGNAYSADWVEWNKKYGGDKKRLQNALKGMDAVQSRFDQTGQDGLPEAYLLGFDPVGKGDGKVILANGNPDTADHTAVYVPGTGSNLGGIGHDLKRGTTMWTASHQLAPDAKISTITWFDYNAPNSAVPFQNGGAIPQAVHDSYAHDGAPALSRFMDGNRAAHEAATGSHAHTTVVAHSYGSTLVGDAAKLPGHHLAVDDVVVLGSPGMQADNVTDLGFTHDHMWAESAGGNDNVVRIGGSLMGLGGHNVIPTDPEFGGQIMRSDASDHGSYWDTKGAQPSVSLRNQADVIVGRYDRVTLVPPPSDTYIRD